MNKAEAAKYVDEPLLGEAALKEALAGFGVLADAKRVPPRTSHLVMAVVPPFLGNPR